ncbi:MAG: hypothetical protein KBC33_00055 [Candidatus Pacebacteria bacterium]|nr:hypothetical protein [Candidatus Paceibacterota bacterium]
MKNSITTEEVERLMRVVSEPLRKQWEANNYDGKSLVELQKIRSEAIDSENSYFKKRKHCTIWMYFYVVGVLALGLYVSGFMRTQNLLIISLFFGFITGGATLILWRSNYCEKRIKFAQLLIEGCEAVFESLQESVRALNPHGLGNTYHDVITAEYAHDRLKSLALRVIDAQVSFDAACKSKFIDRWNITHLGNFIQEAEETFDEALRVGIEDFSLPFEKRKTYEEAQAEYERREIIKKRPPAAPARLT